MRILRISRLLGLILSITHNTQADTTDTNSATTTSQISPGGRIANRVSETTPVKVSKCCPENENLDLTDPAYPTCVKVEVAESPFIKMKGLDMNSKNAKTVDIQLVQNNEQQHGLPPCYSDFEVHRIESHGSEAVLDTWITLQGELVTSRYEAEFEHGEFCVDVDKENTGVVGVMCDACKKGIPCINMCCPHGHAFEENPDYDFYDNYNLPSHKCKKMEGGLSYNPVLWDHNDKLFLDNWKKDKNFLVVGQKNLQEDSTGSHSFECPKDPDDENVGLTFFGNIGGTVRILINGKLEGKDIPVLDENNITQLETERWSSDSFCVIYTNLEDFSYDEAEIDTSEDPYSKFNFAFMTCSPDIPSWCEKLTSTIHSVCLSISVIFLIVTLLVYVCEDSLRRTNPLFSKITIGFISNLIICFIILIDNYQKSSTESLETMPCIISGYMMQYFFLAFFFWINTMSFNIWLKFSRMSMQSPSKEEENKKFWMYFAYAQGTPLLIGIITAIVDATAKGKPESRIHYPNMGKYACFLGAIKTSEHQIFLGDPKFIYFQLFMTVLQIANMAFLGITIKCLYGGWQNQAKLQKIMGKEQENLFKAKFEKVKEQMTVVLRLFVIMGIPWIFELVTAVLQHEHGDETCFIKISLDTINLFAGILIFLVLVAKKPVMMGLKEKASNWRTSQFHSSVSNTKVTDIEMKSVTDGEGQKQ